MPGRIIKNKKLINNFFIFLFLFFHESIIIKKRPKKLKNFLKSFSFLFISLKSEITLLSLKNLHFQILTHVARQNKKIFWTLFQKTFDKAVYWNITRQFTRQFIEIYSKFFSKNNLWSEYQEISFQYTQHNQS